MGNFRPVGEGLGELLHRFRLRVAWFDDVSVGKRVPRQAGDDLGHALRRLQAFQGFVLGYQAPAARIGVAQARLDFADLLLAGVDGHENADLLYARGVAGDAAQVIQSDPAGARQGQRDTDDHQRQEGVERRGKQPAQRVAQGGPVLGKEGAHAAAPIRCPRSSWSTRGAPRAIHCGSCVAITSVTPT